MKLILVSGILIVALYVGVFFKAQAVEKVEFEENFAEGISEEEKFQGEPNKKSLSYAFKKINQKIEDGPVEESVESLEEREKPLEKMPKGHPDMIQVNQLLNQLSRSKEISEEGLEAIKSAFLSMTQDMQNENLSKAMEKFEGSENLFLRVLLLSQIPGVYKDHEFLNEKLQEEMNNFVSSGDQLSNQENITYLSMLFKAQMDMNIEKDRIRESNQELLESVSNKRVKKQLKEMLNQFFPKE